MKISRDVSRFFQDKNPISFHHIYMSVPNEILDLVVVGAGPAGIATAVEAKRAGINKIIILEKAPRHAYSIEKLYTPGKRVDKIYLGQDVECEGAVCIMDGTRETVLATLDEFIDQYGLEIIPNTEVESIERIENDVFKVIDTQKNVWFSRTVVIAIGVYGRPNRPKYPIPKTLKGHIWFDLSEPIPKNQSVLIIGGGNTALEFAEYLYEDHSVTLAYRGSSFVRANEINKTIMVNLEKKHSVKVSMNTDITTVVDQDHDPRIHVTFNNGTEATYDHILYAIGGTTPEAFLKKSGVDLEDKAAKIMTEYRTNVPGLYLAGDLVAGGKGTIVKAFNTGKTVVWDGLCQGQLECRIPT